MMEANPAPPTTTVALNKNEAHDVWETSVFILNQMIVDEETGQKFRPFLIGLHQAEADRLLVSEPFASLPDGPGWTRFLERGVLLTRQGATLICDRASDVVGALQPLMKEGRIMVRWRKPGQISHGNRPWERIARELNHKLAEAAGGKVLAKADFQSLVTLLIDEETRRMKHRREQL